MTNTDTDIAYAAGFFDGEGSVFIHYQKTPQRTNGAMNSAHSLRVTLSGTHAASIQWLQDTFGGTVAIDSPGIRAKKEKRGHSYAWRWQVFGTKAAIFLRMIFPYLKVKAIETEIALRFHDLILEQNVTRRLKRPNQRALTLEMIQDRERLRAELTASRQRKPRKSPCHFGGKFRHLAPEGYKDPLWLPARF